MLPAEYSYHAVNAGAFAHEAVTLSDVEDVEVIPNVAAGGVEGGVDAGGVDAGGVDAGGVDAGGVEGGVDTGGVPVVGHVG